MHPHGNWFKELKEKFRAKREAARGERRGLVNKTPPKPKRGRAGGRAGKAADYAHAEEHKAKDAKATDRHSARRKKQSERAFKRGGMIGYGKYAQKIDSRQKKRDARHAKRHARQKARSK